jgi:hypothetical protein
MSISRVAAYTPARYFDSGPLVVQLDAVQVIDETAGGLEYTVCVRTMLPSPVTAPPICAIEMSSEFQTVNDTTTRHDSFGWVRFR